VLQSTGLQLGLRCHLVAESDPWAAVRGFGKVPRGGQRILLVIASEKHDCGFPNTESTDEELASSPSWTSKIFFLRVGL